MQKYFPSLIALLLVTSVNCYTNSLDDCKTVAKLFKNTCTQAPDNAATWYTDFATTYTSCTYMSQCPGGYGKPYACSWPRKLCVSCATNSTDGKVYMRIQSNTLPDHCSVTKGTPPELLLDYLIAWNPSVTSAARVTFTSQTNFDATACKMEKTGTPPTTSNFYNLNTTGFSATNDLLVSGIMLNGVPMFSSLSGDLVDPFYPKTWSGVLKPTVTVEDVDACLGHPGGGVYHYHMLTNCVASSTVDTSLACTSITACASDISSYALSYFSANKTLTVLGLARDGHLIIGPYATNGSLYDCSYLDQCGGIWLDDGSYAYVLHGAFPYSMNCFGPAQSLVYEASCTTNTCAAYSYTEEEEETTTTTTTTTPTTSTSTSSTPTTSTTTSTANTTTTSSTTTSNTTTTTTPSTTTTSTTSTTTSTAKTTTASYYFHIKMIITTLIAASCLEFLL